MSNYIPTGAPAAQARGATSPIRNEFLLIQTAINSKAEASAIATITAGNTWAGVQDFTGATINVPTPTLMAQAVNKAYADNLVAAATAAGAAGQLPNQSGNTGKYLQTNGVVSSWQTLVVPGTGSAANTGSVTLVSTSGGVQNITPASAGCYVVLPDATTMTVTGGLEFVVTNSGEFDVGIKNSVGTQLGWLRGGTSSVIGLSDKSTAAGVWVCSNLEKLGVTSIYSGAALSLGTSFARISLDATRSFFYNISQTTIYGIVYDSSTNTWGGITTVLASTNASTPQAILSGTNQIFMCCANVTNNGILTSVVSVTGTNISAVANTTVAVSPLANVHQVLQVGTTFVCTYFVSNSGGAVAFSISGTTATAGTPFLLNSFTYTNNTTASLPISSTSFLFSAYLSSASGNFQVITLAGLTLSSTAPTATGMNATYGVLRLLSLNNGRFGVVYIQSSNLIFTVVSIVGGVPVISSAILASVGAPFDIALVSTGKMFVFSGLSGQLFLANCIDTGGTASTSTLTFNNFQSASNNAILASSGTTYSVAAYSSTGAYGFATVDASGTTPVMSYIYPSPFDKSILPIIYNQSTPQVTAIRDGSIVSNGLVSVILSGSTATQIFRPRTGTTQVTLVRAPAMTISQSQIYVPGLLNSESFIFGTNVSGNVQINRVEMAV